MIFAASQPRQSQQFQPGATPAPPPPMVEVRRALPVVPRALPARAPEFNALNAENAHWRSIRFADGSVGQIYDEGLLSRTALLPAQGRFPGDAFAVVGGHYWIWMQPAGANVASWVDP
jgi:hypothetical protein